MRFLYSNRYSNPASGRRTKEAGCGGAVAPGGGDAGQAIEGGGVAGGGLPCAAVEELCAVEIGRRRDDRAISRVSYAVSRSSRL